MGLFSKENKAGQVDLNNLPCHVAVIMDGNGRWAQKRGLPRSAGHKAGAETFRKLGTYCKNLGIDYLTVYAFSTENWKRPKDEVDGIMHLLEQYLHECIDTMEKDGNRLRFLGDLSVLTPELRELIDETNEISSRIEGFQANVCLNYGGRDEILHAARAFARASISAFTFSSPSSALRVRMPNTPAISPSASSTAAIACFGLFSSSATFASRTSSNGSDLTAAAPSSTRKRPATGVRKLSNKM